MVVKLLQAGTTKASVALFYLDATVASDGTLTYTADGSGDRNAQSYSKNVPGLLDLSKVWLEATALQQRLRSLRRR